MTTLKALLEQADFDYRQHDTSRLQRFDTKEFSDRGRADTKVHVNAPRFADNPMRDEQLDEFAGQSKIDRLHQMFTSAEISDQQIKGGVKLTKMGTAKVAARLGVSPNDVEMYINSLVQQLRDGDEESIETLTEQYYDMIDECETKGRKVDRPFDIAEGDATQEDRYSIEPDALGSATVRDAKTGREKFLQGASASKAIQAKKSGDDAVLAPLVETLEDDQNYWDEIKADSGSYNFIWKLPGRHGLGTVIFHADDPPSLRLADVRDTDGNEIEMDQATRHEILQQARAFLGNE